MMKKKDVSMLKYSGRIFAVAPVVLTLIFISGCNRDPNVRKRKYLESGQHYEAAGKLKEATIQFSNALKVDHNYADAHFELGKTYLKLGAIRPGYTELARAVELDPRNLPARTELGELLLAGNAVDRAQEQAAAVIAADPNNADGYALLSAIAARKGDRAAALANIQHALAIKPDQASFHTTLALIESADPQSGTAPEMELQKAIALDGKDTHARMVLAAMLEKKGDLPGAQQQYVWATQQTPKDLQPRAGLAGLYMRANDKTKAEQTLRKAVEDMPENEDASALLKDFYLRTGQLDQAVTTFADLNAKYPKSFPIKLNYATTLVTKGDFAKAGPITDQLVKSNGSQPQVQMLRSAMLLNGGKVNEAYDVLQRASKNAPENLQLQIGLAKVAEMKGDFGAAVISYRAAEKLAPNDLEIQAALGELATQRQDWNMLSQIGEKTAGLRPDLAQGYLWRGMGEANEKLYEKAEADFQTALQKDPNNASTYAELGQLRLRQGRLPEGTALLEKALDKNPNVEAALEGIVAVDVSSKQPDKAEARIQQQIARSPKNAAFYTLLASVQLTNKNFSGAHDNAKKAMELDPSNERAVQAYAQATAAMGNVDEAIQTWDKWAIAHPKDGTALFMLGLLEDQKGDQAKAIENYKKVLQINSNQTSVTQAMAANNLAYLMIQGGAANSDMALTYAQTARAGLPNSPDTADTLALVYYYKGTYLTARDLLEGALKQSPDNAAIHYHLGMTYSKLGRKADAEVQLKKAISLDPNGKTGKDATAALAQAG
ncbi:MAG: tetratricopeptide repeat protein [Acidobacteriaceae bacterium]